MTYFRDLFLVTVWKVISKYCLIQSIWFKKNDQNTLKVSVNGLILHANFIGNGLVSKVIPVCPCDVVALGVVVGGGPTKQDV